MGILPEGQDTLEPEHSLDEGSPEGRMGLSRRVEFVDGAEVEVGTGTPRRRGRFADIWLVEEDIPAVQRSRALIGNTVVRSAELS